MSEQLTIDMKDGMEYETHGSVAAAIASCVFKALGDGNRIEL